MFRKQELPISTLKQLKWGSFGASNASFFSELFFCFHDKQSYFALSPKHIFLHQNINVSRTYQWHLLQALEKKDETEAMSWKWDYIFLICGNGVKRERVSCSPGMFLEHLVFRTKQDLSCDSLHDHDQTRHLSICTTGMGLQSPTIPVNRNQLFHSFLSPCKVQQWIFCRTASNDPKLWTTLLFHSNHVTRKAKAYR